MIRTILAPLDGSTFGEHALSLAAGIARRANASLHLVRVHHPLPATTVAGVALLSNSDLHIRQDESAYLADVARRLSDPAPLPVQPELVLGRVAEALREHVERRGIDLIVMSTHWRGAPGRLLFGGVADELLRQTNRPLLLVHGRESKPDLAKPLHLEKILIALDGSVEAEQVLSPALELGESFGASYVLVRVIKPAVRPDFLPEGKGNPDNLSGFPEAVRERQQDSREEAWAYMDRVTAKLEARGAKVRARVGVGEDPEKALLHETQAERADLIALATHGRNGLARLFIGSVAEEVVRGAEVPVLIERSGRLP